MSIARFRDIYQVFREGRVFIDLRDMEGRLLLYREIKNLIVYDAGILGARVFRDTTSPNPGRNNGLTMLGVGTGATGDPNSPDPPRKEQRRLNRELARRPFATTPTYRDADGNAVSYPTNVLDFTATFRDGEAVGALNEMALMYTESMNPNVTNPIPQKPLQYDPTFDVTGHDILINYLSFGVINKPTLSVMSVTWRLTFG